MPDESGKMTVLEATVQIVSAAMHKEETDINKYGGAEVSEFVELVYKKLQELEKTKP